MIHNCEEKIIAQTIRLGAKFGIGPQLSTKKIASACRLSEATIFVHFSTKENLLFSAFIKIGQEIGAAVAPYTSLDADDLYETGRKMWNAFMDYLIANPDNCRFYCLYRTMPDYNPGDHAMQDQFFNSLMNFTYYLGRRLDYNPNISQNAVWALMIDTSLRIAQMLTDGSMPNTPANREMGYNMLFGILTGAFFPPRDISGLLKPRP